MHAPTLKKLAPINFGTQNIAAKSCNENFGLFKCKRTAPAHFSCIPWVHHVGSESFLLQLRKSHLCSDAAIAGAFNFWKLPFSVANMERKKEWLLNCLKEKKNIDDGEMTTSLGDQHERIHQVIS